MDRSSVGDILHRGGTVLKTARSERFMEPMCVDKAAELLKTFGIEGLVVIGGNGSLRGGLELAGRGITVMGLPGTIDNDLGYTDFTIGFDTAVSTVLEAVSKIRDTSSAHDRTSVIEVMGRNCGDIALYSAVIEGSNRGKLHSIIIKAEGTATPGDKLTKIIEEKTGKETKLIVLSYLQRGGSPTMNDRLLATLCAEKAVTLLMEGSGSKAIGISDGHIAAYDLEDALNVKPAFNEELYRLIGVLSK